MKIFALKPDINFSPVRETQENRVISVFLQKEKMEPVAGRVFGPIPREIAERGYQQIASLAPEVV